MRTIAFALGAFLSAATAWAQTSEVTLTRLDCGTGAKPVVVAERFSDTFAYGTDKQVQFTFSCYLIKHGSEYMVWDTGFIPGSNPNAPKVSLTEQLATLKVTPDQWWVLTLGMETMKSDVRSVRGSQK